MLEGKLPVSFNGIERDVVIYSKPLANISDFSVVADYQMKTGNGMLKMAVSLENKKKKGDYYLEAILFNDKGKEIDRYGKWVVFDKRFGVDFETERIIPKVQPWSAENPNLYTLVLRLKNKKMEHLESVGCRLGFRNIDFSKGLFTINGVPTTIKGVVRCDFTTDDNFPTKETILKELKLMKENNVNAVRVIYAPQHPYFYDLCDEYGIYVFNEANIQPYDLDKTLSIDKDLSSAFSARVRNIYERDKNHPSVVAWSLGYGDENGICFEDAYKFLRSKDLMRPILYNGTETGSNTDFVFSKHKSLADLTAFVGKKQLNALIMGEYGSTKGNSWGSTSEIWNKVLNNKMLQGGFIAYWNDIEIYDNEIKRDVKLPGIVDKAISPKPYLTEIKNLYGGLNIEFVDPAKGRFKITNMSDNTNLKDYRVEYTIFSNLKPLVVSGDVPLDVEPTDSAEFELRLPILKAYAGEEYFIRFSLKQRIESKSFKKGYEYASVEFPLNMPTFRRQELRPYEKTELYLQENSAEKVESIEINELNMKVTGANILVYNDDVELVFDLVSGEITSLKCRNEKVLSSSPKMNFWRSPVDNDLQINSYAKHWETIGLNKLDRKFKGVNFKQNDKYTVSIDVLNEYINHRGQSIFDVMQTIVIYCTGDVIIDNKVIVSDLVQSLPRVGMVFEVPKSFSETQWFGLDKETYSDRKRGARLGTYKKPTAEMFFMYDKPQEAGNREDSRWMSLENNTVGIFFDALDSTFSFSISPNSSNELALVDDKSMLPSNDSWTVNIDYKSMGVGNGDYLPLSNENVLKDKEYNFKVRFLAYEKTNHSPFDFRMIKLPSIESNILKMPIVEKSMEKFNAPMTITLSSKENGVEIRYTLDGTEPNEKSTLYKTPFVIDRTTVLKAKCFKKDFTPSLCVVEQFDYNYINNITYLNNPNTPYNKNSELVLFDGEKANILDLDRGWLGFSGSDFDVVVSLVKPIEVENVKISFAHVPENWAFSPSKAEVMTSEDSISFSEPYVVNLSFDPSSEKENTPQNIVVDIPINAKNVKYVKIVAKSIKKIPYWHNAKGLSPWIMVDELKIKGNL